MHNSKISLISSFEHKGILRLFRCNFPRPKIYECYLKLIFSRGITCQPYVVNWELRMTIRLSL